MKEPDIQSEILSMYYSDGRSMRAIARELGINRKTVKDIIERRQVLLKRMDIIRPSLLDPYKAQISDLLKREPRISSVTVLMRIRASGYMGGYTILKDYLSRKRDIPVRSREPFLRLDFAAGDCAQVDWGEFGNVFGDGIKIHCFVMVLCYSRLLYLEFTRSEKFEEFIRCHENAFHFFGNLVPKECWYDNLATAVTDRMGQLIRFNSRFMAYMGHHGLRPHACNPARGNEKGRVEDGVKYIRGSFFAGRQFADFDDLCRQAAEWRDNIANQREHRSTRKIPKLCYDSEEKGLLRPMNDDPYETDEVISKTVPPDFHIIYETNRYSVPWTLVGMVVTIKSSSKRLRMFYHEKWIAAHERSYARNKVFTQDVHLKGLMDRKPGANRQLWQIEAVKSIGPALPRYLDLLKAGNRSLRSEAANILGLATIYGNEAVQTACEELLNAGVVGVPNLELLLKKRTRPEDLQPAKLSFHTEKLNREFASVDLRRYDALLFEPTNPGEDDGSDE